MPVIIDELEAFDTLPSGDRRRRAVDSPYLHRLQRRHFVLFDVLPLFGTVVALGFAFVHPVTAVDVSLLGLMWLVNGLGISAGFHRLFAHRSYKTTPSIRVLLAVFGCMGGQGAVISWAAMHRRHHQCADIEGDMHSPNLHGTDWKGRLRGFVHAHYTWMARHEYPNVAHYVPDLLRDRALVRTGRLYRWWVLLGLVIPAALGGLATQTWMGVFTGFLWGGVVRLFLVGNLMWSLNSFLHTIGRKAFRIPENAHDQSGNSTVLALLAWGEGWHNNHHAFPYSASFGLAWYRIDVAYWFIRILEAVGLARDVLVPGREHLAARAVRAGEAL
jgi:stearoyl-CoA desaturase (delta-9 desaturase)